MVEPDMVHRRYFRATRGCEGASELARTCSSISKWRAKEYAFSEPNVRSLQAQRSNPVNLDERLDCFIDFGPRTVKLEALGQVAPSVTAPCDASATRRIYFKSTPLV